jgi:hypothetical protein
MPREQVSPVGILRFTFVYENGRRFIVREFEFSEEQVEKQKEELAAADTTEKELWVKHNNPNFT